MDSIYLFFGQETIIWVKNNFLAFRPVCLGVRLKPLVKKTSKPEKPAVDQWNPLQWESWSRLMVKIKAGDHEAYRQLLEELGPVLYKYVRRRVFDAQLVGDVYQDVMLRFHKAHHTYEPNRPLGPWLFAVAQNAIFDSIGKHRKFVEKEIATEYLPEPGQVERDGSLGDELQKAMEALPELNRKAIELLKLKGLSLDEAAQQLDISVTALKARAHRGYLQLRSEMLGKKKG